ncbi:aminotransferase A [Alicyclobacillus tolerans]|uniref:aminotransferase A n=1 Tax=Alicyclobacillus tolerans TaxID=90970 RepID=UPI001F00B113|nr:aminotransferase A [Alicyclobacillus tolerans]MCF8565622.1 aminotransferase A [Alicyclobacillus tolerans]
MQHLLNARVKGIAISGIRKFSQLAARYPDAIHLTLGQPDFLTPEHVKQAAKQAIDRNQTTYTANAGLIELRQAASSFLQAKYALSYDPETEIIATNGTSEAIDIALRAILEEGSEVILPGPVYPGYEPLIRLAGAKPVYVDTRDTQFRLDAKRLSDAITPNTRCVILPYPSNPTGTTLSQDDLEQLAQVLNGKPIFILSDEIYSELVYDRDHVSIAHFPSLRSQTIVVNGLSKSHAMTGWRIGFTFAPKYITEQMIKVHQYNASCASSISQHAAIEALGPGANDALGMREEYRVRRDYVCDRLASMGLALTRPSGAFYAFPSIERFSLPSFEFSARLLEEARVAVVPGDAFSQLGEGYIRLSYAYSMEQLTEGLNRLERFVKSL